MAYSTPQIISDYKALGDFENLCSRHHIEGLLYSFYDEFRGSSQFKSVWLKNWHRNDLAQKVLIESVQVNELQHKIVLLKGFALLGQVYLDSGSRFMSDVDLLVHPCDFTKLEKMLIEYGFLRVESKKWKANSFKSEWSIVIDGTEVCIELHSKLYFHVSNRFEDFNFEESHIQGFWRLSSIDQLIHLSTHYAFQHTFQSLYWAFDFYFYFLHIQDDLDMKLLSQRALRFKVSRSLDYCLSLLVDHFQLKIELDQKLSLSSDFLWSEERRSFEYLKIKHLTKDSLIQALEYDFLHFFSRF